MPVPYSIVGPLNQIVALLEAIPGMNAVQVGAPLSWATQVNAYVTLGPQVKGVKAQGTFYRDARYYIDLGYRCDDNAAGVSDAELVLAGAIDAIDEAINADKTLAGTSEDTNVDTAVSEDPEYRMRAGREFREYGISIVVRQYTSYNPTP